MLFGLRITHRKPNLSVPGKGNAPSIGPEILVNRESVEFGAILLYDYYIAGVLFIKNNKWGGEAACRLGMDAKKTGAFIARIRKEKNMTQAELASRLKVTDKAVSRWERGIGLPDINTLEPLSDVLGVTVLEIMKGERIQEESVDKEEAVSLLSDTLKMSEKEKKRDFIVTVCCSILGAAGVGLVLLGTYLYRWKQNVAISLVGGADGPTSVFIAAKINPAVYFIVIGLGAAVASGAAIWLFRKRRR